MKHIVEIKVAILGYDTAEEAERDLREHVARMTGGCKSEVLESRVVDPVKGFASNHANKVWHLTANDKRHFCTEMSELSHTSGGPGKPLLGPWNEVLNPGDLHPETKDGEVVSWDGYTQSPEGIQAKLTIFND
jgi:hypothetical protein